MKQSLKFLLYICVAAMPTRQSNAQQNTFPILSTSIETWCSAHCFDFDSIPINDTNTTTSVVLTLQVFEITGIASIRVKLGTTDGGSELLDKTFAFDVSGSVGNGCTYSRTDYTVTLGMGDYNGLTTYYSELILERADHSLTDAVVFNR